MPPRIKTRRLSETRLSDPEPNEGHIWNPLARGISTLAIVTLLTGCVSTPETSQITLGVDAALHDAAHQALRGRPEAARRSYSEALRRAESLPVGSPRTLWLTRARTQRGDWWLSEGNFGRARLDYEDALETAAPDRQQELVARLVLLAQTRRSTTEEARLREDLNSSGKLALARLEKTLFREHLPAHSAVAHVEKTRPQPRPVGLEIIDRSEWGPSSMGPDKDRMTPIHRVTVHHSGEGVFRETSRQRVANKIRAIQSYHQNGRQWADIGYHYVIDPAGRVWGARPVEWQGSHAGGNNNRGNIGICLLGNFDHQPIPTDQSQALVQLLDTLMKRYGFAATGIHTHAKFKATACPGAALQDFVDRFKEQRTYGLATLPPSRSEHDHVHAGGS